MEEKLCIVGMLDIVSLLAELVARLRSTYSIVSVPYIIVRSKALFYQALFFSVIKEVISRNQECTIPIYSVYPYRQMYSRYRRSSQTQQKAKQCTMSLSYQVCNMYSNIV